MAEATATDTAATATTTEAVKTDAAATTETKTDTTSVLGTKTDGTTEVKTEGEKTEGKTETKTDAKPAALAATDFKLPDGFKVDEAQMGSFVSIANELGLSKEKAQALINLNAASVKAASEASSKVWADQQKAWQDEAKTTYGPEPAKNPKIIAVSKMIDSLGEKPASDLRLALEMSGMGNHPAFVSAFTALAERLTEPGHAKGAPASKPTDPAQAFYPNMKQG